MPGEKQITAILQRYFQELPGWELNEYGDATCESLVLDLEQMGRFVADEMAE